MKTTMRHASGFDFWTQGLPLRSRAGFTLIELLVVVAILGILAAIAIPMFMGQREKAKIRSVVSSSKNAVQEVQGLLDSYVAGDPFIVLDQSGSEICVQAQNAAPKRTCNAIFRQDPPDGTYSTLDDIITYVINHHEGKADWSPFGSGLLFKSAASGNQGEVVVTNANGGLSSDRSLWILGYAVDTTNPIFNTIVTAR